MNKKALVLIAIVISVIVAIPILATLAVKPKPKILLRLDLPITLDDPGTSVVVGDNVIFKDQVYVGDEASLVIFQWSLNPTPPPSHLPAPSIPPIWDLTHSYDEGLIYATTHGNRDLYTFTGKWHMEFTVTFVIDEEPSGFNLKHDCTGVGLAHAASWSGQGFGVFEGLKVSGVSIADLSQAMPVTKILWGEVSSGHDNLPPPNVP